jgi:hypothetical protein
MSFPPLPLPPEQPNERIPTQRLKDAGGPPAAFEDRDNFIRDLGTVLEGIASSTDVGDAIVPPVTPTPSAALRDPVLTLNEIKIHCHIEIDQTVEDDYLKQLEMAARLHAENYLRYQIDSTVGENIKQALLFLIALWYRNREGMGEGKWVVLPAGFQAMLALERDYPTYT